MNARRPAGPEDPGDACGLYVGRVMHQRLRPRRHRLSYRVYSLLLDIDELPRLDARLRWFSVGRFNLFSFHPADHGDGSGTDLRAQLEARLRQAGLPPGGALRLLAMPRVLGHVFNPLGVWFCHAPGSGALQAIVYEVHNTFGERHAYLVPVTGDAGPVVDQRCDKRMHVSPFNGMDQQYRFRIRPPGEAVSIGVSVHDALGPVLNARLDGRDVYSDNWAHDYAWLARLFESAELSPRFHLRHLRELLDEREVEHFDDTRAAVARELQLRRHRASSDARVLQMSVARAWRDGAAAS